MLTHCFLQRSAHLIYHFVWFPSYEFCNINCFGWLIIHEMHGIISLSCKSIYHSKKVKKKEDMFQSNIRQFLQQSTPALHFNCLSFFYLSRHKSSLFHLIGVLFFQGFLIAVALVMDYHLALCYMVGFLGTTRSKLPKFVFRIK